MGRRQRQLVTTPTWEDFPPLAALHPTARKILAAAHQILQEEGLAGLTFDAIARASGQYKGSITYFFGDKATLIAMLADLVSHDTVASARERLRSMPPGPQRIHEAVQANSKVSRNVQEFRLVLDIAAQALRTDGLRQSLAQLYESYREINRGMLDDSPQPANAPELDIMATLSLALVDGLSLQHALDPEGFDPDPYWREWEEIVTERLAKVREPRSASADTGATTCETARVESE